MRPTGRGEQIRRLTAKARNRAARWSMHQAIAKSPRHSGGATNIGVDMVLANCLRATLLALPLAWLACSGGEEVSDVGTDSALLQGESEAAPTIDKAQVASCCGYEALVVCSTTGEVYEWIQCNGVSLNQAFARCNPECDGDCVAKNATCDL
jgi:hypothetical protein